MSDLVLPQRIQQRRTAGWRMPDNAKSVTRGTRWGNPYKVMQAKDQYKNPRYVASLEDPDGWIVVALDKRGRPTGSQWAGFDDKLDATRFAVDLYYRSMLGAYQRVDGHVDMEFYLAPLLGHDLACFCPLILLDGSRYPCHADALLKLCAREESRLREVR